MLLVDGLKWNLDVDESEWRRTVDFTAANDIGNSFVYRLDQSWVFLEQTVHSTSFSNQRIVLQRAAFGRKSSREHT